MGWFTSEKTELHAEIRALKSKLFQAEFELRTTTQKLLDARISATKVRARYRTLREERRRLHRLLERHNISWEHEATPGVERPTST